MTETDDDAGGVIDAAMDVDDDEYVRRRRLKAINDARERAAEMPARTWPLVVQGKLTHDARHQMIFSAVQAFVREVRPALEGLEETDTILTEEPLGAIPLAPPTGDQAEDADEYEFVGVGGAPGPHEVMVKNNARVVVPRGLRFVLENGGQLLVRWRALVRNHTKADDSRAVTDSITIPEQVTMNAFGLAIDALDDTDLSISAKTERDEYDQEYGSLAAADVAAKTNGHR